MFLKCFYFFMAHNIGAEFELNLPHTMRSKVLALTETKLEGSTNAHTQLLGIFDEIIREILILLRDSFMRFRLTPGFREAATILTSS